MKQYFSELFLAILAIFILCSTIEASEIRVNSLGFIGLVQDEEMDLLNNPASICFIGFSRIFTGINYFNQKNSTPSYTTLTSSEYLEYAIIDDSLKFSLRCEPYYSKMYYSQIQKGLTDFSVKVGIPEWEKVKWGVKLGVKNLNSTGSYSTLNEQDRKYQIDIGLINVQDARYRIGLVFSAISEINKYSYPFDSYYPSDTIEEEFKTYEVRLLPEWTLGDKLTLRGMMLLNYHSNKYTDRDEIASTGGSIHDSAGLGWNYQTDKKTLLIFSVFQDLTLIKEYRKPGYKESEASLVFRAGIEKELLHRLLIRGFFDVLRNDFVKGRVPLSSQEILSIGSISLGYRVLDNLNLDFAIRSNSVYLYRNGPDNRIIDLNVAGTYYF